MIKYIFQVIRCPLAVRVSVIVLALIGCCSIVVGLIDPSGMALRGLSSPILTGVALLAISIPTWIGVRLLVWLWGLLLVAFGLVTVYASTKSDTTSTLVIVLWLIVLVMPAASIIRHEFVLNK